MTAVAGPSRPTKKPGKKGNQKIHVKSSKKEKRNKDKIRIQALEDAAATFEPPENFKSFAQLPISECTRRGLKKAFFVDMTDIQRESIPVSLKGKDVLGAARTGSGKTLAFLVPILELLYRQKWGPTDGLGALIISPTRELAVQIFEVLKSIGGYHSFSAGLVIGGKNLKDERDRLSRMNILVATPGRLLQHMDQTFGFECDNLQMLVLDEADRILDMGFSKTLSALLEHLPKSRQTLLFSATQTQSVKDLARLSLKDPVPIGVGEAAASTSTSKAGMYIPTNLEQHYLLCSLDQKLSVLWGFIRTHLTSKILVFMSSCKQVRFVYETFCKMQPGISLIHLHGKQKQSARLTMYDKFTASKHAVLFATDIAARGLDFPAVDWVLQLDAPEDAETYIHRVGRTARYESKGRGLLFLMPSEEEGMRAALEKKGIVVEKIKIKATKAQSIESQLQALCFQDPEIKYLGQRAFVSYLRSVYLHKDKSIFKVNELPVDAFAESLGLPGAPKIRFLDRQAKLKKNADRGASKMVAEAKERRKDEEEGLDVHSSSDEDGEDAPPKSAPGTSKEKEKEKVRTKYDRMFQRKNQNILSEHYARLVDQPTANPSENAEDGDGDEFITLKRADHALPSESTPLHLVKLDDLSKRKLKRGVAKRKLLLNAPTRKKIVFGAEGEAREVDPDAVELAADWVEEKGGMEGVIKEGEKYAADERGRMRKADVLDRAEAREKKQEKKRKRKERENARRREEGVDGPTVVPVADDDGYVSPEFDLPDEDEEDTAPPPPSKRQRRTEPESEPSGDELEDEEAMALRLLRSRR